MPYNRGKHYNFWALRNICISESAYGYVDQGIDIRHVVAQSTIPYDWEDTGETLLPKLPHDGRSVQGVLARAQVAHGICRPSGGRIQR